MLRPILSSATQTVICLAFNFSLVVFTVSAQEKISIDTVLILNGEALLQIPQSLNSEIKKSKLRMEYDSEFGIKKLQCATGYQANEFTSLRIFHTKINYPSINDGGILKENLINQFISKLENSRWIESGMKIINGYLLDYVKLNFDNMQHEMYGEFIFYEFKGMLTIIFFQCLNNESDNWISQMEHVKNSIALVTPGKGYRPRFNYSQRFE